MTGRGERPAHEVDGAGLGRRVAQEVDDEIEFHVDARTAQLMADGMTAEAARAQAHAEFGPMDEAREVMLQSAHRARRRRRWSAFVGELVADARHGVRSARARPGPFAVAVLSIAIGMAAVSSIWTTLDRLVLRPLPYDGERTLVYVGTSTRSSWGASNPSSAADFRDLRAAARTVRLAAYRDGGASLGGDVPEWVTLRHVTPDFFDVLTVAPALGRGFGPDDGDRQRPEVALISHGLWERRFASEPGAVGTTIRLDGRPLTVVGVLPPRFGFGRGETDVWLPMQVQDDGERASRTLFMVGRMNTDLASTRAELLDLSDRLAERFPESNAERVFAANTIVAELSGGPTLQQGIGGSLAAAFLVLLIACANVANLLMAWGADRAPEIALRRALGASRARILRKLLVEAVLLAGLGGALGVALSFPGIRGLATLAPQDMARMSEMVVDGRNVAVGMAIALGSTLLFGVLPAWRTLVAGEGKRLMAGGRGAGERGAHRLRSALVAVEVGVAVVLVTMTALVARSFDGVRSVDTGFETEDVWTLRADLPRTAYPAPIEQAAGLVRLRDAVDAVPGVRSVGLGVGLPGGGWRSMAYRVPGGEVSTEASSLRVLTRIADPTYLAAVGLEPLRGRALTDDDTSDGRTVALVNETFAAEQWPDEDPIGRTLSVTGRTVEVVGVMPDAREIGARFEPRGALYLPLAQWPAPTVSVVFMSTAVTPPIAEIRRAVGGLEGSPAVRDVRTLESVLLVSADQLASMSKLLAVMAASALLLALIGVYASMSYTVVRRVPEIGIRMALGADGPLVLLGVIRQSVVAGALGLAGGLPVAWALSRGLSQFVDQSAGSAPGTYLAVSGVLMAVSIAAAWVPARRASRVHPADALRAE